MRDQVPQTVGRARSPLPPPAFAICKGIGPRDRQAACHTSGRGATPSTLARGVGMPATPGRRDAAPRAPPSRSLQIKVLRMGFGSPSRLEPLVRIDPHQCAPPPHFPCAVAISAAIAVPTRLRPVPTQETPVCGNGGNDEILRRTPLAMLTDIKVKNAKPGRYSDGRGDGLMLLVRETGARIWIQRIKVGAKRRDIGHGSWPGVTLAEARRKADAVKEAVARGVDPIAARQEAARAIPTGHTLREAMEGYIAAHSPSWRSAKTAGLFRRSLEQHAAGLLAREPSDIALEDVRAVLAPIWPTKPVLAQKIRSRLEHSLEWAMAAGWRPAGFNPAAWRGALRTLLAKPSAVTRNRHHPALPWVQVPAFMAALRDENGVASRCLEFAILTASRSGEARAVDWGEVDLDAAMWVVPGARMKAGKMHRVPLSGPAVALLCAMMPNGGAKPRQGLVFANAATGAAFSDAALLAVVRRMDAGAIKAGGVGWRDERGEKITPHGFRSAFRDWCGDTGQPREIAEAALAHAMGSATERAYARSDLFERRRLLMQAWAEACAGAAADAKVISLPARAAS